MTDIEQLKGALSHFAQLNEEDLIFRFPVGKLSHTKRGRFTILSEVYAGILVLPWKVISDLI